MAHDIPDDQLLTSTKRTFKSTEIKRKESKLYSKNNAYPFEHVTVIIIPGIRDIHAKYCSHQRIDG